jgi:hypothetical protein
MFRMGIIVAGELPRDRSTLLVRFLAGRCSPTRSWISARWKRVRTSMPWQSKFW